MRRRDPKGEVMTALPRGTSGRDSLAIALEAARLAGRLILERFGGPVQVSFKGRANVVTDVDRQVEQQVLALLQEEFPTFSILAEESPQVSGESPYTWIVDPLDGTRNFASAIPHFCVVIALAHRGEVVLGITYDPVRDELFLAQKGRGASLNGQPIHASRKRVLAQSILGFDLGYHDERARRALELAQALWPGVQGVRIMGSSALGLAYTAAGRVDLYFHHSLSPWDLAAGLLLVQEAGGVITDRDGLPATLESPTVIASNTSLHAEFLRRTEGLAWRLA